VRRGNGRVRSAKRANNGQGGGAEQEGKQRGGRQKTEAGPRSRGEVTSGKDP